MVSLEVLAEILRVLQQPPEPEVCRTCGAPTGDVVSLTRPPLYTHCPHCGADLCPF
jgi:hypothetical protein